WAFCLFDRKIIESREIEWSREMQQAVGHARKIAPGLFRYAIVIDNDNLVIVIAGLCGQAVQTSRQELDPIASRYDDRDFPGLANLAFHPVGMCSPVDHDMARFAPALDMFFDRASTGFQGERFPPNVIRRRSFTPPPMIKNTRHMMDPIGLL